MTNKELWKQYQDYTQDTSTIARKLGFGAIAICWIFKYPGSNSFPLFILYGIRSIVAYFVFDLSQYFISSLIYRIWIRIAENRTYNATGSIEGNYDKPSWLDNSAFILWIAKLIALFCAYAYIGVYIFN